MISTDDFRTKTEMRERDNGKVPGVWEVAMDAGYSAVKYFSPNGYGRFPSFAKNLQDKIQFAGAEPDTAIQYIGDDGSYWAVGDCAYAQLERGDTSDSEAALFGRERYLSPMWRVITDTGIALSISANKLSGLNPNDRLVLQTGLPQKYLTDTGELIESLEGDHSFSLKIGRKPWQRFSFRLDPENIFVMSQPKGTLFSVCMDSDGRPHQDARKYLQSSGLVFDPGFGTLDIFPIVKGTVRDGETFADLGMKRVLEETAKEIYERYHEPLTIPQLQSALGDGVIRHMDRKSFSSKEYGFGDILEKQSKRICDEAIERLVSSISLVDYNYMIVTGGTGAAWYPYIADRFREFTTLRLLKGNQNDGLPFVYANCRGYYLYREGKLRREANAG